MPVVRCCRRPSWPLSTRLVPSVSTYGDKDGHLQLTASAQLATTPVYISGVIAVGSSAGILYFVDQQNGSAAPNMFSSIDFGSPIVSLGYNSSRSQLMVGTSDPTPASN